MQYPLDIIIMAAGKGTRMKSAVPKVLQKLAHQGLVQHVLDTAAQLQARQVVVVTGHGAEQVEAALAPTDHAAPRRQFVRQMPQLGTGHGQREDSHVGQTGFERLQAQPNEVITIRYDSRENLIAFGVIHEPVAHRPNPFPRSDSASFVPDPPLRRF